MFTRKFERRSVIFLTADLHCNCTKILVVEKLYAVNISSKFAVLYEAYIYIYMHVVSKMVPGQIIYHIIGSLH